MVKLLLIFSLFINTSRAFSEEPQHTEDVLHGVTLVSNYDADTITPQIPGMDKAPLPMRKMLGKMRLRVDGIDTPEIRGGCPEEKALALEAKKFTAKFLEGKKFSIVKPTWGKYAGRFVGVPYVKGQSLADALVAAGYAVPYSGKTKRPNWCKILQNGKNVL